MSEALEQAIMRACRLDSLYMAFLDAENLDRAVTHEIEVRLDATPACVASITAAATTTGWTVRTSDRLGDGLLFLRRRQDLRDAALFEMFREVLTLAHNHQGRFHSWSHEPNLDNHAQTH